VEPLYCGSSPATRGQCLDAIVVTHGLCALCYLTLGLFLAVHSSWRGPVPAFVGACLVTGAWALCVTVDAATGLDLGMPGGLLRVTSGGAWLLFIALGYRAALPEGESLGSLWWVCAPAAAAWALLWGLQFEMALRPADQVSSGLLAAGLGGRLVVAVAGLYCVELLLRRTASEARWRVKHVCIGVGALYVFDIVLASEALLMRRIHPGLEASRGAVTAIVAPLIALGVARNPSWSTQLNFARRAVVHSAVLVGVGLYLLALAAAGALSRAVGGDWATLLQATVLFSGLLLLTLIFASARARAVVRQSLSSYLFTYRHDYREVWQRFTESLAGADRVESLRERSLRAVATITDSPGGGLWIRRGERFVREAGIWVPESAGDPEIGSAFAVELEACGERPLALGAVDDPDAARHADWIPEWLCRWQRAWVLIPLRHRQELIGFIVLVRPPVGRSLHREDAELLETVAAHVAGHLVEEQRTQALEEGRRFAELSRGMAFIAHDLRNLANELSLTLSNARKHISKPEFQKDMLLSMEDSVATMQRLLDRLKNGVAEPAARAETDLGRLLADWIRGRHPQGGPVRLELEPDLPLPVAADRDRLVSITGHLVSNAVEAVGPEGRVVVRLRRDGVDGVVEVDDDGPGMTQEFLRERLLHPFGSSKAGGFGIGLYECRKLAAEMGGELSVESSLGKGTVARVRIPLALPAEAGDVRS
jgi:putative PEP-CTERM system histidine kinase